MFHNVNKVFGAKCAELKLAKVKQKQPICQEDFQKLYECGLFDTSSPVIPQNKVFSEVMLSDLLVMIDANGKNRNLSKKLLTS